MGSVGVSACVFFYVRLEQFGAVKCDVLWDSTGTPTFQIQSAAFVVSAEK